MSAPFCHPSFVMALPHVVRSSAYVAVFATSSMQQHCNTTRSSRVTQILLKISSVVRAGLAYVRTIDASSPSPKEMGGADFHRVPQSPSYHSTQLSNTSFFGYNISDLRHDDEHKMVLAYHDSTTKIRLTWCSE